MQPTATAKGNHVTLLIKQPDLPSDEQDRDQVLKELQAAVESVLANHDREAERITVIGGHSYAAIPANCPECGDHLRLIEPTLDETNGAFATASCGCGWRGDATYRLIDLEDTQSQLTADDESESADATHPILQESSSVRDGAVEPQYIPY